MLPSIEHLDWKRHPTPEQEKIFTQMLNYRYGPSRLRVVITLDDKAFELAVQNRALFGDAPIVFGGVNHFDPKAYGVPLSNVTGVEESKDFYRTLDLIRRLQPDVTEIVGYHDNTESALANRDSLEEVIPQFAPHLTCRFIENWTKDELLDALGNLPPHAAAFSLGATRDRDGVLLADDLDFLKAVAQRSSVPIYLISEPIVPLFSDADWNSAVWSGVGGSLVSGERHGEQVGKLALRVLQGERADEIPVVTNSAGRLAVDWRQMKRFDLPIEALPKGTEIYNQPDNFYRIHKRSILIGVGVLIVLAVAVVILAVNIMLRRRAERENAHLVAAVEQAEEIVIMLDTEGLLSYMNPAFSRITGWSEKKARKTSLACLEPEHENSSLLRITEQLREHKICSEPLPCRHKDGSPLQLFITGSAVVDSLEKVCGYILIARDMTRETTLEEQVQNAQKMEAIGLLAGGVAHDFNNLLQVIMGHAQMAIDTTLSDAEREESLTSILDSAKRGAQLPRQLLAFGRRQPLNTQDTNLNEFVKNILKVFHKLIGENIEVEFLPCPDINNVRVDHGQLEQVILNLCINARDAISNAGKLTFRLENVELDNSICAAQPGSKAGKYACLHVEDNGCGMDEKTLNRVFEPFFTTKSMDKGSGLGLAVVYGIIQQHNGLIQLHSTPGKGTTVSLYLPVSEQLKVDTTHEPATVFNSAPSSATILVVEDETAVRDLSVRILKHAGYHVLEAKNGLEAVECFSDHANTIDMVLMDMVMPKMSGPEARKQIAKIRPDIPILYSSGYSSDWVDSTFETPLNTKIIQKPYDATTLLSEVATTLKNSDHS